ncbi:MAG: hypothetical protein ABIG89_02385 [Candidatus Woesearchaeota archaeon]
MKRLIIDIDEELHEKLELLSGGIRSFRDKIVVDLLNKEVEDKKDIIEKMKEVMRKKQMYLDNLRGEYKRKYRS